MVQPGSIIFSDNDPSLSITGALPSGPHEDSHLVAEHQQTPRWCFWFPAHPKEQPEINQRSAKVWVELKLKEASQGETI